MRRRRNADASSSTDVPTDTTETNVSDEAIPVNTDPAIGNEPIQIQTELTIPAVDAAEATGNAVSRETPEDPEKKPRPRAPRRKSAGDAVAAVAEEPSPTPALEPEPVSALAGTVPAEKPKRAPRRRAPKATVETAIESSVELSIIEPSPSVEEEIINLFAPVVEATADEAVLEEIVVSEPEIEPAVAREESEAETQTMEKRSRRRRSSRRGGGGAENTGAVAPAAETEIVESSASASKADVVSAAPPPKAPGSGSSSRRNRSGKKNQNPSADAPTKPVEDSSGPKRIRGLRRIPAPGTTFAPAIPAPEIPAETASVTDGDTTAAPKRIRGLRTRRVVPTFVPALVPTLAAETAPQTLLPPPYQPLPDDVLARLPETKIIVNKGIAELVINGAPQLPLWFFVNTEAAEDPDAGREIAIREIRMAYEAGIRFFTLLSHLPWKMRSGERRYDILDGVLQMVAENAPDALVLPRLIFSPPMSWERVHPDAMTLYADGETGDVSFASREFWEGDADQALRAAVEHVAEGPHAARVFGFYLEHAEWLYEKGRGYDVSPANETRFRVWLRERYDGNEVTLRAAWHDGAVTFDDAPIPAFPPPPGNTLFFGPRETRWSDFHEYSSDVCAQTIVRLGKAVKEASGGRSVVAVSYGYTLEINRAASGHYALRQILDSPNVDILTGPISYSGRTPGGSATFPAPIDSLTLAGKLWVSEDDSKTYLAGETPDTYNPKIPTLEGTRAVHARNFGAALARGTGISWMDLWGEGWLDDAEIWKGIAYLRNVADAIAARRHSPDSKGLPEPDVAVIVDEQSFFGVRSDEFLLGHLVAQQRDALLRSGANIGFYLLSDLLKPEFPAGPKLLLFLNAYHIPNGVRSVIRDRFQNDGRTLAWLYAPGTLETSDGAAAELSEVIGMQLKLQPWGSKAGTQAISGPSAPLRDALRGQKIGEETRYNPTYYAADPKATAFGEYTATGNPSIAVRKHPRWQSVFIGEVASLTVPLLRGLYRLAGIPTLTMDDDVAWVGENLLCLHSAPGGDTTVYLSEESVLFDLLTGETLASDGFGARFAMPPKGTRLLFFGLASEVARLGGDPNDGPPGLVREDLPVLPVPFVFEAAPATATRPLPSAATAAVAVVPVNLEDEALFAAALDSEFGPVAVEEEEEISLVAAAAGITIAESEAEAARKKRRRRRRGRGRRTDQPEGMEGADAESGAEGDTDTDADTDADLLGEDDDEDTEPEEGETLDTQEREATPGVLIFDVVTETFAASAPPGPQTRVRPSLAELLPLSDLMEGSELPPIPDELLPLTEGSMGLTGIGEEMGADLEAPGEARARRPRGGAGRYRRGRQSAQPVLSPDEAETLEAISEAPVAESIESVESDSAADPIDTADPMDAPESPKALLPLEIPDAPAETEAAPAEVALSDEAPKSESGAVE